MTGDPSEHRAAVVPIAAGTHADWGTPMRLVGGVCDDFWPLQGYNARVPRDRVPSGDSLRDIE